MKNFKIIALFLVSALVFGLTASGVYAFPDCRTGVHQVPMRMEGCGGGSGCCGCEMDTPSPSVSFDPIAITPSKLSPELFSEETNRSKNLLRLPEELPSRDSGDEESSPSDKLYDLYSKYRV